MAKTISRFQYITQDLVGKSHYELASRACIAGTDWVQLRVKNKSYNEWLDIALETKLVCTKHHAKLIINDSVIIAKAAKADGVHLGKTDMSPSEARKILGDNFIIGGTANSFEDIKYLVSERADYIGLGPYQYTTTKENLSPVIGLEGYGNIIEKCNAYGIKIPLIAIGGIKIEDIKLLIEKGLYGIAVSSAVNLAENSIDAIKRFKNKIKLEIEKRA